jgi:nicotinate-nucleotide--dimethylbenzimidazole phosphoribosyltransferase
MIPDQLRLPEWGNAAAAAAREIQTKHDKARGGLGRLEDIVIQMAGIQSLAEPEAEPATTLLFSCDHPVAVSNQLSKMEKAYTEKNFEYIKLGTSSSSIQARILGVQLKPIDLNNLLGFENDFTQGDSLTEEFFTKAFLVGYNTVKDLDNKVKVLITGDFGFGSTTVAAATAAGLLPDQSPAALVGRGSGLIGESLKKKVSIVEEAVNGYRNSSNKSSAAPWKAALLKFAGFDIVAMLGAMAAGCERQMLVMVDGFANSVSALALVQWQPAARRFLLFSQLSAEKGHGLILDAIMAEPLLRLNIRHGEAAGSLLAYQIVQQAALLHKKLAQLD